MMNIAARALSALFLLLLLSLPLAATVNPNAQRGFAPDAVYQFNEVDHINVFTGAPTVTIPIGRAYTSGDRLQYNFMLSYNAAIWDSIPYATTAGDFTEMYPGANANAGVGWLLSLGDLSINNFFIYTSPDGAQHPFKAPTLHFGSDSIPGDTAVLYTRDGSYLRMRDTSTAAEKVRTVDFPDGTSKEFVCIGGCNPLSSASRFVLRTISDPFGNTVTIERDPEPQGTTLPAGTTWRWWIREGLDGGQQTEHYIDFEYWPYAPYRWVVREVNLMASPSSFTPDEPITTQARARYKFNYVSGGAIYRPPQHTASTQLTQVQTNNLGRIYVPLLESIELPDGSFWRFGYYQASGEDIVASFPGRPYTTARNDGLLNRIVYPTGGGVRYEWGTYVYPHRTCIPGDRSLTHASSSPGVRIRQLIDRAGHDSGQPWRYISTTNSAINNQDKIWPYDCEPSTTFRNTIVDPLNNVTVNYFSVYVRGYTNPYNADPTEYGLSLSRQFPDPANTSDPSLNRYLSTRTFRCTTNVPFDMSATPAATVRSNAAEPLNAIDPQTSGSACTELRKTYVRYESSGDDCPPFDDGDGPGCVSANRRLASQRTVYVDDGNAWIQTDSSDFDGLGHYRSTRTTSNFFSLNAPQTGASHPHGDVSVATTRYNPIAQFNLAAQTYSGFPAPSSRWLLTNYDRTTRTEEKTDPSDASEPAPTGGTATAEYLFDDRGFLQRKRVLKGNSQSVQDVLVTFNRADAGSGRILIQERYYGGDSSGVPLGNIATIEPGNPDYAIDKTYRFGTLEREEYKTCDGAATVLLVQRNEIDPATGLPMSTRDASGAIRSYLYDEMGRLTRVQPPGEARMQITYTNATSTEKAFAKMERKDAGDVVLATSTVSYDDWGRISTERKQLPGGVWNRRTSTYHPTGWLESRSTIGPDDDTSNKGIERFPAYDPFGRPLVVQHADDSEFAAHTTTYTYRGARSIVETMNGVATNTAGTGTTSTTRLKDAQGRLQALIEASAGNVATVYEYDTSGRLVKADAGTQSRSWQYDNRGFLTNEKHPELDPAGVSWRNYDALGHAHDKYNGAIRNNPRGPFDVSYQYDGAGRLTAITLPNQPLKPLKTWAYFGNNAIPRLIGKLRKTQRYNYVPDSTKPPGSTREIVVSELYEYTSWNHRVSEKRLTAPGVRIVTNYDYDGLGDLKSIAYPQITVGCVASSTCPTVATSRTVTYQYENGFLKTMPGYVKNIGYNESEIPSRVLMQNNVAWLQDVTNRYFARPSSLRSEGISWSYGPFRYDANNSVYQIGSELYTYDAVNRLSHASTGSGELDFQYDRHGNRTNLGNGISVSAATNRLTTTGIVYDEAGNLTHFVDPRDTHTYDYTYDRFNAMTVATAQDSAGVQTLKRANVYDIDDERVATIDYISAKPKLRELWSARDLTQRVLRDAEHLWDPRTAETGTNPVSRGWTWKTDYVYRLDGLVATFNAAGPRYVQIDHLGTPRAVTDANGALIDGRTYEPFGLEVNVRPDTLRKKFTGHERDDDGTAGQIGDIDYMHARFYSPAVARFLSIDPLLDLTGAMLRPQGWNRYSYVQNNPLSRTDPDGRNATVVCTTTKDQKGTSTTRCVATVDAQIVAGTKDEKKAAEEFKKYAEDYWNRQTVTTKNKEEVTFKVNFEIVEPGKEKAGKDTLHATTGEGRSEVKMNLDGKKHTGPPTPDGGTIYTKDNTKNPSGMQGIAPHETGHLFGLRDTYPSTGVPAFVDDKSHDIMEMAQPKNSADSAAWVLSTNNGNTTIEHH